MAETKDTAEVKERLLTLFSESFGVTSRTRSRVRLGTGTEVVLKYSKKHGPRETRFWFGIVPKELESTPSSRTFIVLALGSDRDVVVWPLQEALKILRPELRSPDGQWKINIEHRSSGTTLLVAGRKVPLDVYVNALGQLGGPRQVALERKSPSREPNHNRIRDMIREIGEMEHYVSETEYHFDHMILDAVWKRTRASFPAVAFEVQIGGNYYEALSKLKHGWDKFNSKPVLVTTEKFEEKVDGLLDGSFHEIQEQIRIVNWKRIEELHEAARKLSSLRSELEL